MIQKSNFWLAVILATTLMSGTPARADLYQAAEAVQANDLPKAFQLYRELAELGHVLSQEIVAAMYVNGEGVKRDNVLGYAWAKLALENGSTSETAKSIAQQIEPHLTEASRARVTDLRARFGKESLQASLLPEPIARAPLTKAEDNNKKNGKNPSADAPKGRCTMTAPADPSLYYPEEAKKRVQGKATVAARVHPDGSVRNPVVLYSFPVDEFVHSARALAIQSRYSTQSGGAPCHILFRITYEPVSAANDPIKEAPVLRELALSGDPRSQAAYGMLLSNFPKVTVGDERPVDWFIKAAQAGVPAGQFFVARHLSSGWDLKKDLVKARRWFEMAAKSRSLGAMVALAQFEFSQTEDAGARARGVELLRRAAESQDGLAMFYLAALQVSDANAPWYDPAHALELMDELGAMFDYDPAASEIRAAAYAGTGNFDRARSLQVRAVRQGRANKWDVSATQARLADYEAGKVWSGDLIEF